MNHTDCIAPRPLVVPRARPHGVPRILQLLWIWHERSRQRHQLSLLDERLRRDIGVTAEDVLLEARKPFWRE